MYLSLLMNFLQTLQCIHQLKPVCICVPGYSGKTCTEWVGEWTEWSPWDLCRPACGDVRMTVRSRDCLSMMDGVPIKRECRGPAIEYARCAEHLCAREYFTIKLLVSQFFPLFDWNTERWIVSTFLPTLDFEHMLRTTSKVSRQFHCSTYLYVKWITHGWGLLLRSVLAKHPLTITKIITLTHCSSLQRIIWYRMTQVKSGNTQRLAVWNIKPLHQRARVFSGLRGWIQKLLARKHVCLRSSWTISLGLNQSTSAH